VAAALLQRRIALPVVVAQIHALLWLRHQQQQRILMHEPHPFALRLGMFQMSRDLHPLLVQAHQWERDQVTFQPQKHKLDFYRVLKDSSSAVSEEQLQQLQEELTSLKLTVAEVLDQFSLIFTMSRW
jgi:hypothetical protein